MDNFENNDFSTQKLNNFEVKIPDITQSKNRGKDYTGKDILPNPDEFSNVFVLAKKHSGKTVLLYNLLYNLATRNHKVLIFCSSYLKDKTWKAIMEMLDNRGIPYMCETNFKEKSYNHVQDFIDASKTSEEMSESKYILLFDDLGREMRDQALTLLMKFNRHHNCHVFCSSQDLCDLSPGAIKQLDHIVLFDKQPADRLKKIHQQLDLSVDFDDFLRMYHDCTKVPYRPLCIYRTGEEVYTKNFRDRYLL